jgi:hypothetical protein
VLRAVGACLEFKREGCDVDKEKDTERKQSTRGLIVAAEAWLVKILLSVQMGSSAEAT